MNKAALFLWSFETGYRNWQKQKVYSPKRIMLARGGGSGEHLYGRLTIGGRSTLRSELGGGDVLTCYVSAAVPLLRMI